MLLPRPGDQDGGPAGVRQHVSRSAGLLDASDPQVEGAVEDDRRVRPCLDAAEAEDGLALGGQDLGDGVGCLRRHDRHHADAAVEGAEHLGLGDRPGFGEPAEHRRHVDRGEVDSRGQPRGSTRGILSTNPPPVM